VKIESRDPNVKGSTVINGMQKLSMRTGEAPPENPDDVDEEDLAKISECLKDIHGAAVAYSRKGAKAEDRMAAVDGQVALLPIPPFDPLDPLDDPLGEPPNDPNIEPPNIVGEEGLMPDPPEPTDGGEIPL